MSQENFFSDLIPQKSEPDTNFFDELVPSFTAWATGYHPVEPGGPEYQMEGGKVGAEEWHGQKIAQEPLYTLDQYRKGKAPYVSVAMDNTTNNPLPYGSILESPDLPGIPFRLMDTGSAFNGKSQKYGGPKGLSRIDIARDTNQGANSSENNRNLTFKLAGDDIRNRIEAYPKMAGETTQAAVESAADQEQSTGMFGALVPKQGEQPSTETKPEVSQADNFFGNLIPEETPTPTPTPTPEATPEPTPPEIAPTVAPQAQPQIPVPESPSRVARESMDIGATIPDAQIQDFSQAHPIVSNAAQAAYQVGLGFIPKSDTDVAKMLTPVGGATDAIKTVYGVIGDFIQGKPIEETKIPESQLFVEADKTPPFSKERFSAAFQTLANIGMIAAVGGAKQARLNQAAQRVASRVEQQAASYPVAENQPILNQVNESLARVEPPPAPPTAGAGLAPKSESVRAAAIRFPNGNIVTGEVHGVAWEKADQYGLTKRFGTQNIESGFVTSTGRFISAEEATAIKGKTSGGLDASEINEIFPPPEAAGAGVHYTVEQTVKRPRDRRTVPGVTVFDGPVDNPSGIIEAERLPTGELQVFNVAVDPKLRGTGRGVGLYQKLINEAGDASVLSDSSVSESAANAIEGLRRRGYTVEKNPAAELKEVSPGLRQWITPDNSPVFKIAGKPPPAGAGLEAPRVTSTKNAVVDAERKARGLEPILDEAVQTNVETMQMAEAKLAQNPGYGRALVADLLVGGKRVIDAVDEAVLLREKIGAQNIRERSAEIALDEKLSDMERAQAKQTYEDWERYISDIDKATYRSGQAWGRMGQFRQRLARQDYSLVAVERRMRIAKGGKPLTPQESVRLKTQSEDVQKKQSKLIEKTETSERQTKLNILTERMERRIAQMKGLEPKPTLSKFETIADHELEAMRVELARLKAVEKEQNRLPEAKRRTAQRIEQLEKRMDEIGFQKPPIIKKIVADKELRDLQHQLAKSKETLDRGIFMETLKTQNLVQKTARYVGEILAVPRALRASMDLSALRRQGGLIFMAHPIRALNGFVRTLKGVTEKGYHDVIQEIRERPNYSEYHQTGLSLTDVDPMAGLSQMEEVYQSRWARSIPILGKGVAASERLYVGFLNRLRADSFDAMKATLGRNGEITLEQGKVLSNFINVFTGRGGLPDRYGAAMVGMNQAFFAPRYVLSRFQTLIGQPIYARAGKGAGMKVRALVAGEYARMLAGYGVTYGLIGMALDKAVDFDPRSGEFGKIKIGNVRIDILSGVGQATVFTSRIGGILLEKMGLISGSYKTGSGKITSISGDVAYGKTDVGGILTRFGRSKLAPVPATAWDYLQGKNMVNQPVTLPSAVLSLTVPLSWDDMAGAIQDQGASKGSALGTLALFGDSIQSYSPRIKANPFAPPLPPPPFAPPPPPPAPPP